MNNNLKTIILSSLIGSIVGGVVAFGVFYYKKNNRSNNDLIKEFYLIENAVYVSPHGLREKIADGKNDFTLVDLRSQEEYETAHIVGAINIAAYKNPDTSAYDEKDRIIGEFKKLSKDKDVVVYCYSMPCMTGRKIGQMLAENGIYAKHLGIGWNEWRYYWDLWNHDGEAPSSVKDYIISGKEPGVVKIKNLPSPCIKGEFGC